MKGIILKDLYENFRIFKNGVSYLAAETVTNSV